MLKAFVLICAALLPRGECSEATAIDVQMLPKVSSLQQCMFLGQAQIAPTTIAPHAGEYAKVVCQAGEREAAR